MSMHVHKIIKVTISIAIISLTTRVTLTLFHITWGGDELHFHRAASSPLCAGRFDGQFGAAILEERSAIEKEFVVLFILWPCAQVNDNGQTLSKTPWTKSSATNEKDRIGYFAILPDEILVYVLDNSLNLVVKFSGINKFLKTKLKTGEWPLRLEVSTVGRMIKAAHMNCYYNIVEVVWLEDGLANAFA